MNLIVKLNRLITRVFVDEQSKPSSDSPERRATFSRVSALEKELETQGFKFDDEPLKSGVNR